MRSSRSATSSSSSAPAACSGSCWVRHDDRSVGRGRRQARRRGAEPGLGRDRTDRLGDGRQRPPADSSLHGGYTPVGASAALVRPSRWSSPRQRADCSCSATSPPSSSPARYVAAPGRHVILLIQKGGGMTTHVLGPPRAASCRRPPQRIGSRAWFAGGFVSRSPSPSCSPISWRSTAISSTACTRQPHGLLAFLARSTGYDLVAAVDGAGLWRGARPHHSPACSRLIVVVPRMRPPGPTGSTLHRGRALAGRTSTASPTACSCRCSRSSSSSPPSREADSKMTSPARS